MFVYPVLSLLPAGKARTGEVYFAIRRGDDDLKAADPIRLDRVGVHMAKHRIHWRRKPYGNLRTRDRGHPRTVCGKGKLLRDNQNPACATIRAMQQQLRVSTYDCNSPRSSSLSGRP